MTYKMLNKYCLEVVAGGRMLFALTTIVCTSTPHVLMFLIWIENENLTYFSVTSR